MENQIKNLLLENQVEIFGTQIDENWIQFQKTRKENRDIFENKSLLAILDSLFYLKRIF